MHISENDGVSDLHQRITNQSWQLEILDMLVERITDNFDLEEKIEFRTFCNHIVTRKKPFCLELEELQVYGGTS